MWGGNTRKLFPHLDLSALHNRPVQLFSCPVSLSCALKGDKPKALQVEAAMLFIFYSPSPYLIIIFHIWQYFSDSHLWSPLIEDNLYIQDLSKLLKMWEKNVTRVKCLFKLDADYIT